MARFRDGQVLPPGPDHADDITGLKSTKVRRVGASTVVKYTVRPHPGEAAAMELVRTQTRIPVPALRRSLYDAKRGVHLLVMEFVPGRQLEQCWPSLSLLSKVWVLWKVRSYIHQLRAVRPRLPNVPGPVGDQPLECIGRFFTHYDAGPFATYDELAGWFSHKLEVAKKMGKCAPDAAGFDASEPLVMTHQDLCPRNFILGDDGQLWLVDWEWSGFYPRGFEYAAMAYYRNGVPRLWRWALPWMAGFYWRVEAFMKSIGWPLTVGHLM